MHLQDFEVHLPTFAEKRYISIKMWYSRIYGQIYIVCYVKVQFSVYNANAVWKISLKIISRKLNNDCSHSSNDRFITHLGNFLSLTLRRWYIFHLIFGVCGKINLSLCWWKDKCGRVTVAHINHLLEGWSGQLWFTFASTNSTWLLSSVDSIIPYFDRWHTITSQTEA